jgi:predicted ATP-grasp superfamily ATP-dependent carboligase
MFNPARFLVVAHSARLLAQSAARARHPVCALDLFNDADTGRFALASEAVHARGGAAGGFDREDLLRRAARLCPPSRCLGLVYGAGFEDDTETLALLARGRELLGNRPELVAGLKDPAAFFGLLDRLAIPHPQTELSEPVDRRGWLYKRRGATGGAHVIDAAALSEAPGAGAGYFQRREAGRSLSLLFLADGRGAEMIGISEQLTRRVGPHRYAYAGAVGPIDVAAAVSRTLRDALQALVARTGLVGCNSLDFLLDGHRPAVLEINPRPSATMDLYDAEWPGGLFEAHLQACRGRLPSATRAGRPGRVRAHAIVYAGCGLRIAPGTAFPAWCSDIPRAGSGVPIDAPVCTVHADGADAPAALRQLTRRRRRAQRALATDGRAGQRESNRLGGERE